MGQVWEGGLQDSVSWTGRPVDLFPGLQRRPQTASSLNGGGWEVREEAQRDKETPGQSCVRPNVERDKISM